MAEDPNAPRKKVPRLFKLPPSNLPEVTPESCKLNTSGEISLSQCAALQVPPAITLPSFSISLPSTSTSDPCPAGSIHLCAASSVTGSSALCDPNLLEPEVDDQLSVGIRMEQCNPDGSGVSAEGGSVSVECLNVQTDLTGFLDTPPKLSTQLTCAADFSINLQAEPFTLMKQTDPADFKLEAMNGGPCMEWKHFLNSPESSQVPVPADADEDCHAYFLDHYSSPSTPDLVDVSSDVKQPQADKDNLQLLKLFEKSELSVRDSVVAILSFSASCHLNGTDFCRLLDLLNILLPKPNNLPPSKHLIFSLFENDDNALQVIYYCNSCWRMQATAHDTCNICPNSKIKYYLTCSIIKQLQKICSRKGIAEKLRHKFTRTKESPNNIEDIYDGHIYLEVEDILGNTFTISLSYYTDGVSLFNCSSLSLWPFIFVINELPPEDRYKEENLVVGGLWADSEKPHPNVFLLPIYKEVSKMKDGFPVHFDGATEEVQIKAIVTGGNFDSPARSSFMNMKGHAGYFSGPKCFIRGEKSARTGNVMVFPHEENVCLRDDANYNECVKNAVLRKEEDRGVLGPSVLSYLVHGSFIRSTNIDSMHCIFLGLTKQHLRLWFDSKYSDQPFSMVNHVTEVNRRLRMLNLPHFVQRLPEDVTKLHFWKASLLRNFFFFFAQVVLKGLMKQEYYENFTDLVEGVAILHRSSVSLPDIAIAEQMLNRFSENFQKLYGLRHMSSNVDLVRHLGQCVRDNGNLCITECFKLEDLNGKMASLVHGTTHVTKQIFTNIYVLCELPLLISSVENQSVQSYCSKLVSRGYYLTFSDKIAHRVYVVGNIDDVTQHVDQLRELISVLYPTPVSFRTFSRMFKHKVLYVSSSYSKGTRVSSFCSFKSPDGNLHGKILTFVKLCVTPPQYFAYVLRSDDYPTQFRRHAIFSSVNNNTVLIPVNDLICVSFYLNVNSVTYVVDPLNRFELE